MRSRITHFFVEERHFLVQRLEADLPTLGICLGAQLMARAWLRYILVLSRKWLVTHRTHSDRNTLTLVYLAAEQTAVLHWHGDTFDLPAGAAHLATSTKYQNQGFAWGNGLALQFHPEVTGVWNAGFWSCL